MIKPTEPMDAIISENYETRPIVERDKNEIADLIVATYKANPSIKIVHSKQDYIKLPENIIKNKNNNEVIYNSSKIIIDKNTNEIVGVCLHMEFEGFPLITQFAVRPDHQGKGIGSYLLKHSISYASKKYLAIRLYVFKNNPALEIYEHLGFIKNRTLNDMYLFNE